MRISAVAWDVDGTLVHSEPRHHRALLSASALWGVDLSDLPDETFQGVHVADVWSALKTRYPSRLSFSDWLAAINDAYLSDQEAMSVIPGALETVKLFAEVGVLQICVSNSNRPIVDANIEGLGISKMIVGSISLDDVTNGKPNAEPYLKACSALGIENSSVVAIEDSATGLRSAVSAGLLTVAFTSDPIIAKLADFATDDLRSLQSLFGSTLCRPTVAS